VFWKKNFILYSHYASKWCFKHTETAPFTTQRNRVHQLFICNNKRVSFFILLIHITLQNSVFTTYRLDHSYTDISLLVLTNTLICLATESALLLT